MLSRGSAGGDEHRAADAGAPGRGRHRPTVERLYPVLLERRREPGRRRPHVGHGEHADARLLEGERRSDPSVGRRRDHGALAGLDPVEGDQPAGAARQHHAGNVVAREDERLLDRARRVDVVAGADLVQRVALPDRDEPVEVAERRRRAQDLDPGRAGLGGELAGAVVSALPQQPAAGLRSFVSQHDIGAELGGGDRGGEPGAPAADDEHVGMAPAVLGAPRPLGLRLGQPSEARRMAEHLFVQRPQPSRADERLVVEAGGRERAADRVGHGHRVELEAGARVEMLDASALAGGLGAGPDPGRAVDRDQAIRALAGAAHQPPATVVLEAPRERAGAGCVQRRADRVPGERRDALAVERERDRLVAVDPLTRLWRQPLHLASPSSPSSPGSATRRTSLVRVSRSAWNHVRHPDR